MFQHSDNARISANTCWLNEEQGSMLFGLHTILYWCLDGRWELPCLTFCHSWNAAKCYLLKVASAAIRSDFLLPSIEIQEGGRAIVLFKN